jgi:hypothetical protein
MNTGAFHITELREAFHCRTLAEHSEESLAYWAGLSDEQISALADEFPSKFIARYRDGELSIHTYGIPDDHFVVMPLEGEDGRVLLEYHLITTAHRARTVLGNRMIDEVVPTINAL